MLASPENVRAYLTKVDAHLLNSMGIDVLSMAAGKAVGEMLVKPTMCNSLNYCHGGLIFSLADTMLAYACMSGNRAGVTLSANIIYNKPAKLGDTLTAVAEVVAPGKRTATCDVVVTNQDGIKIAHVQGVNYYLDKSVIPSERT